MNDLKREIWVGGRCNVYVVVLIIVCGYVFLCGEEVCGGIFGEGGWEWGE